MQAREDFPALKKAPYSDHERGSSHNKKQTPIMKKIDYSLSSEGELVGLGVEGERHELKIGIQRKRTEEEEEDKDSGNFNML